MADVVQEEATLLQLLDWSLHVPTSHTSRDGGVAAHRKPQLSTASYPCESPRPPRLLQLRCPPSRRPRSASAHAAPRPPGAPAVDAPARELQACISRPRGAAAKAESSSTARGFYIGCAAAATAAPLALGPRRLLRRRRKVHARAPILGAHPQVAARGARRWARGAHGAARLLRLHPSVSDSPSPRRRWHRLGTGVGLEATAGTSYVIRSRPGRVYGRGASAWLESGVCYHGPTSLCGCTHAINEVV